MTFFQKTNWIHAIIAFRAGPGVNEIDLHFAMIRTHYGKGKAHFLFACVTPGLEAPNRWLLIIIFFLWFIVLLVDMRWSRYAAFPSYKFIWEMNRMLQVELQFQTYAHSEEHMERCVV